RIRVQRAYFRDIVDGDIQFGEPVVPAGVQWRERLEYEAIELLAAGAPGRDRGRKHGSAHAATAAAHRPGGRGSAIAGSCHDSNVSHRSPTATARPGYLLRGAPTRAVSSADTALEAPALPLRQAAPDSEPFIV